MAFTEKEIETAKEFLAQYLQDNPHDQKNNDATYREGIMVGIMYLRQKLGLDVQDDILFGDDQV